MAMDSFAGKLAVVTGVGSGMGRELTPQLAAQGRSVAGCDPAPGTGRRRRRLASCCTPHSPAGE